jgi:phosphatidylglycerophosphate synthase
VSASATARGQAPARGLASHALGTAAIRGRELAVRGRRQANALSYVGASLCLAAGASLALGASLTVAAVLFPLGGLCDYADGLIARTSGSRDVAMGAFIDSMCDKVGEAALLFGLFLLVHAEPTRVLVVAAYSLGALTSYTKAVAGEHALRLSWPEARKFGRAGRVILLSVTLAVAAIAGQAQHGPMTVGLAVLALFNASTLLWRISRVFRKTAFRERH